MGNEMINEVEYLIRMLKEEWSVSKETKEKVVIDRLEAERFVRTALRVADEVKKYIDEKGEVMELEESMRMMKQSCALFRLVRKICGDTIDDESVNDVIVEVDEEERKLLNVYF